MYIGAEIKNEHMSEGWRGGKNETAEAQAGGRNQVTNPTSRHRRRCPRGCSVVSVVARTFGLLLLLSPYPPPPPSLPSACRSRPVRQCFWTSFLSVCISPRSKHRERRWEKEIAGSRRLALVWRVSLRLFHTVRTVALSLFSVTLHGRTTRKSRAPRLQVDSRYSLVGSSFHRSFEDRVE